MSRFLFNVELIVMTMFSLNLRKKKKGDSPSVKVNRTHTVHSKMRSNRVSLVLWDRIKWSLFYLHLKRHRGSGIVEVLFLNSEILTNRVSEVDVV